MFIQQSAWLNTKPKGNKAKKRRDMYPAALMPDVDPLVVHMLEYFSEASTDSWQELESWQRLTGNELTGWEASVMIRLHSEYIAYTAKSEGKNIDPPFAISVQARREQVLSSFKNLLEAARQP